MRIKMQEKKMEFNIRKLIWEIIFTEFRRLEISIVDGLMGFFESCTQSEIGQLNVSLEKKRIRLARSVSLIQKKKEIM